MRATSFVELYGAHSREIYRFALYLSGDPAMAEDIVSETFLRVWDSPSVIRTETVRGYLFTIARNVFLHTHRQSKRLVALEDRYAVTSGTERRLQVEENLAATLEALQTLPEIDRTALLMHAQEDVSYEEIARVLGLSLSSVKVKIHRARLKLAEQRSSVCK